MKPLIRDENYYGLDTDERIKLRVGSVVVDMHVDNLGDVHIYFEQRQQSSKLVAVLPKMSNHIVLRPLETLRAD